MKKRREYEPHFWYLMHALNDVKNPQHTISPALDSSATLRSIKHMALDAGVPSNDYLKSLQADLKRTADPQRALNNLHRFLSAGFHATTLRDFHRQRVLQRVALELFAQSQYLADILVRNPELFTWITSAGALGRTSAKTSYLEDARNSVAPFERFEKKLNALRRFQRRELLRIGAREILKEVNVAVTAEELSRLADAVVSVMLDLATHHILADSGLSVESTLTVVGLGKLGGNELNFSSDIDLLFVYDTDGEFDAPGLRMKTYNELYSRIAELAVRKLTEHTDEGHFYRVDLRLRPEGTAGAIALSRSAAMNYYETRGELWERQMLMKARVIAGNTAVGERFLRGLTPFIFPRTHLGSPLNEIAAIKRKIEEKTDAETNIKLGSGGIRDIEFIVQALQLLNAGRKERLRERNTQAAVTLLAEEELLNARETNALRTAYTFFRTVEHRLQLLFGKQTHSLPESAAEMEFLAKRLGFRAATAFKRRVEAHRWAVRMIFSSVFALKQQRAVSGGAQGSTIVFKKNGFIDPRNAAEQFSKLKNLLPEVAESGLQSKLLTTLKKYKAPDWGLQHVLFLADNPHLRRSLLQALSNDGVLDLLGLVCSRSVNLAQLLAREPLLFETLLSNPGEVLGERFGWELLKSDLRHYQSFNEFKLGLRWLTGGTNIAQAVGEYSRLADEIVVQRVHELAHDLPIAVYALGKYGGREITARSDLDVLFVYRKTDESSPRKAEELARRFSASFIENGILVYDVDMRLRPEGKSAPLAVEISYYRDYLQRRASLWERQSLVKFRAIAGDEKLVQEVESVIHNATYAAPLPRGWVDEVAKMRSTMEQQRSKGTRVTDDLKVGRGGLVDIEFLLQMLQLKFGANRKELQTNNSFELLNVLGSAKLLQKRDVTQLLGNLTYLRSLETLVRFNTDQSGFVLPKDAAHLAALAAGMGEKSARAFLQHIKNIQKVNRTLLNHVYTLCKR